VEPTVAPPTRPYAPLSQAPTQIIPPAWARTEIVPPPPAPPALAEVESPWPAPAPQAAVVLPMTRNPIRSEYSPPSFSDPTMDGLERLLRLAAARGASTLYLSSDARPSVRVDGELQSLDGEAQLTSRDVESLLLT